MAGVSRTLTGVLIVLPTGKEGSEALHERIEMGYLGVSGLVISLLMLYVIG